MPLVLYLGWSSKGLFKSVPFSFPSEVQMDAGPEWMSQNHRWDGGIVLVKINK